MDFLPKIQEKGDLGETVRKMNIYINSCLEKTNGWNRETKLNYKARVYIYQNICADIELGEKPTTRQTVSDWIEGKVSLYAKKAKIIHDKKTLGISQNKL